MSDYEVGPNATSIGAGLVLNEDEVAVLLVLGNDDDNVGGIAMPLDTAAKVAAKLLNLVDDGHKAQEAIKGMGTDAAWEYMSNLAKRSAADLN